jgi:hypothetical protein
MTSDPEHPEGLEEAAEPFDGGDDAFISRNRDALAAMITQARQSLDRGEVDERTIDDIIAQGRLRLKSAT